jgi:glycosyltransferase involved in cell wall biosynthesis
VRIAFANNYYYLRGGSERVFFDEISELKGAGHQVAVFSREHASNLPTPYSRYFPPHLQYEGVPVARKVSAAASLVYSDQCGRRFGELLEDFRPDLVHGHNIYGRLTTAVLDSARTRDVPTVMTLHDHKLICPSYLMLSRGAVCERCEGRKYYHCLLERCHKGGVLPSLVYTIEAYRNSFLGKYRGVRYFLCPSAFLKEKHARYGIPEERLEIVPNFLRMEEYLPGDEGGEYVVYAGRLSKEKGLSTLLRAVEGLDVPLRIVGDGPMRESLEVRVRERCQKNVVFEGYKTGVELATMFRRSLFVVFPSEWYENAPMSILEAFAYGKPVIGANIGGVPEMITDGETGFLFPPGDAAALRERIRHLAERPSLVLSMGRKARRRVEERHTPEVHMKRLTDVYAKALS